MRLLKLGDNAHALETAAGTLLFSYERLTAVRLHDSGMVFRAPDTVLAVATRAHLQRFAPGPLPLILSRRLFADACRRVLKIEA